mmetsp:Transcript_31164/g.68193  ORF Transcript_31164/g.68193 Transcript_31164/m.68193 type:complete len:222 (+) Transcript_31164:1-666(+)
MAALRKVYKLSARSMGRAGTVISTDTGHTIRTDVPKHMGGDDIAPQPVELLLAALVGCKTTTAHFVSRHLWRGSTFRIEAIEWLNVTAERDNRGAVSLPIDAAPAVVAGLSIVTGVARVNLTRRCKAIATARGAPTDARNETREATPEAAASAASVGEVPDLRRLGEIVAQRCPVGAMVAESGCVVDIDWQLGTVRSEGSDDGQVADGRGRGQTSARVARE